MLTPIKLEPLPASAIAAARQAISISKQVAATGLQQARADALKAMLVDSPNEVPSERKRLRALYRQVYSQQELEDLIGSTFRQLGISE